MSNASRIADWVQSRPTGLAYLIVVSDQELSDGLREEDWKAQLERNAVAAESELDHEFQPDADDGYASVWISRHVSPDAELKIPRDVEIHREQ